MLNLDTARQFFLHCGVFASSFDAQGVMVPEFHFIQTEEVA